MTVRKVPGGYVHSQAWPTAGEPDYEAETRRLRELLFRAEWALSWALDKSQGKNLKTLFAPNTPPMVVLYEILETLYNKPEENEGAEDWGQKPLKDYEKVLE